MTCPRNERARVFLVRRDEVHLRPRCRRGSRPSSVDRLVHRRGLIASATRRTAMRNRGSAGRTNRSLGSALTSELTGAELQRARRSTCQNVLAATSRSRAPRRIPVRHRSSISCANPALAAHVTFGGMRFPAWVDRAEWGREDSNLRRLSRRVYSPFPLAARAHPLERRAIVASAFFAAAAGLCPTRPQRLAVSGSAKSHHGAEGAGLFAARPL
jgi:hypothetical protein